MYQRYQIYTGYTKHRLRSLAYGSIFFLFLQVDKMIEHIGMLNNVPWALTLRSQTVALSKYPLIIFLLIWAYWPIMVHWSTPRKAVDQDELARPWPRHGNPQTLYYRCSVSETIWNGDGVCMCVCVCSKCHLNLEDMFPRFCSCHWILHSCALYVLWILCIPYLGIGAYQDYRF